MGAGPFPNGEPAGVSHQNKKPITVAILGGDPLVGQALKLLLEGAGYDARFLNGSFIDKPAELPKEVRLVLLMPGLDPKGRKGFLKGLESASTTTKIPVLELVAASDEAGVDRAGVVRWPCRVKDLERQIEAALLEVSRGT